MVTKLYVYNNPYVALEFHVEIDFILGQAFYKNNTEYLDAYPQFCTNKFYECFFLLPKEKINDFIPQLNIIDKWETTYGDGFMIDGFYWSVRILGDKEKAIQGANSKPKEFDDFIAALEILLQKDFSYSR